MAKVPGAQFTQAVCPVELANFPAVQAAQAVCPVIALNRPSGQGVQEVCPDRSANVPAGQLAQGSWPVALNCPGGQLAPHDAPWAPTRTATAISAVTCHHALVVARIISLPLPYHRTRFL